MNNVIIIDSALHNIQVNGSPDVNLKNTRFLKVEDINAVYISKQELQNKDENSETLPAWQTQFYTRSLGDVGHLYYTTFLEGIEGLKRALAHYGFVKFIEDEDEVVYINPAQIVMVDMKDISDELKRAYEFSVFFPQTAHKNNEDPMFALKKEFVFEDQKLLAINPNQYDLMKEFLDLLN